MSEGINAEATAGLAGFKSIVRIPVELEPSPFFFASYNPLGAFTLAIVHSPLLLIKQQKIYF